MAKLKKVLLYLNKLIINLKQSEVLFILKGGSKLLKINRCFYHIIPSISCKNIVTMKKKNRIWIYPFIIVVMVILMSDCKKDVYGDCTIHCICVGSCEESKTYVNVLKSDCDLFAENKNLSCNCSCTHTFVER